MAIADEQIHPTATGAALKTVEQHAAPQDLMFYSGWFCPFVQRSWIALEERGVPYQYKEVNPYRKEEHFLKINPKGLVPAVEYQGKALYESLVLCEFFEDAFPQYKPNLLPSEPVTRAFARIWIDFIGKSILPHNFRLMQGQTKEKQDEARKDLIDGFKKFQDQIKGPYFLGEEFSLVDVAIVPWIVRDYIITEHRGFKRSDVGEKWENYAKLVESRDSVLKTCSDKEHFVEIYGRYLRDEAQSGAAKAIRSGGVIP